MSPSSALRTILGKPFMPPVFFFSGVTYDTLTLTRIDRLQDNLLLLIYLLLLGVLIVLIGRLGIEPAPERSSVPLLTLVAPVKVFAAVVVSVPLPAFVTPPAPLRPVARVTLLACVLSVTVTPVPIGWICADTSWVLPVFYSVVVSSDGSITTIKRRRKSSLRRCQPCTDYL